MTPNQPNAPPLTPIGEAFELVPGALYECVGHQVDRNGKLAEVPGRYLGKAPKTPKQNKHSGQRMADAPTINTAIAPSLPAVPLTPAAVQPPATQPAAPRQRTPRRAKAARRDYRRFPQKPPPLVIVNEPWTAGQWAALIVVLALVVAGLWLSSAGAEQKKWERIEGAARAIQGR